LKRDEYAHRDLPKARLKELFQSVEEKIAHVTVFLASEPRSPRP